MHVLDGCEQLATKALAPPNVIDGDVLDDDSCRFWAVRSDRVDALVSCDPPNLKPGQRIPPGPDGVTSYADTPL